LIVVLFFFILCTPSVSSGFKNKTTIQRQHKE
jgi:hypothetical protein